MSGPRRSDPAIELIKLLADHNGSARRYSERVERETLKAAIAIMPLLMKETGGKPDLVCATLHRLQVAVGASLVETQCLTISAYMAIWPSILPKASRMIAM